MAKNSRVPRQAEAPSGGAYALAGFAYQLMGSLGWAVDALRIEAKSGRQRLDAITLVLEPRGGDAEHHSPLGTTVVQYKDCPTTVWTEGSLARDILADLNRAQTDGTSVTYRFETSGKVRFTPGFRRFLQLLRDGPLETALAVAEIEGLRLRAPGLRHLATARQFMAQAAALLVPTEEPEAAVVRILGRLEIIDGISEAQTLALIDRDLRRAVAHPADVPGIRQKLLGALTEAAKTGSARLSARQLLEDCGIPIRALEGISGLRRRLADALAHTLGLMGYDTAVDARGGAPLQLGGKPAALCGPSGVGKTWILARAAAAAERAGALTIWIDHPSTPDAVRREVANRIQGARGHGPGNPHALRGTLSGLGESIDPFEICVLIDRIDSPDAARALLEDPWWSEQGVGLLLALPASATEDADVPDIATRIDVDDFQFLELRRFLKEREVDWVGLPWDVRRLLRRPGLAKIYADLGHDLASFRPHDEYELIDAVWSREPPRDKGLWRDAMSRLRVRLDELADDLITGRAARYPLPLSHPTVPFDARARELLERAGLIRWADGQKLVLDHDRLLAWGLAQALASGLDRGCWSTSDLLEPLKEMWGSPQNLSGFGGRALGYVPLDLMWALLAPSRQHDGGVIDLVRGLTAERFMKWSDVATLGGRALGVFVTAGKDFSEAGLTYQQEFAQGFVAVAQAQAWPPDAEGAIDEMLSASAAFRRRAALQILIAHPSPNRLNALIQRHAQLDLKDDTRDLGFRHQESEDLFNAAKAAAQARPSAILAVAQAAMSSKVQADLAWLAAGLPPTAARRTWALLQGLLTGLTAEDGARLADKFLMLGNRPPAQDAIDQAASDGFLFEALSAIDPEQALQAFDRAQGVGLVRAISHFELLLRRRPEADARLLQRLAAGELTLTDLTHRMWSWAERAGAPLWSKVVAGVRPDDFESRSSLGRLVANTANLDLINHLQGSDRLQRLALAFVRDHLSSRTDGPLDLAEAILLRTGGSGLARLADALLSAPDSYDKGPAFRDALVADDLRLRRALERYAEAAFHLAKRKHAPLEPLRVLALVDPQRAGRLGRRLLRGSRPDAVWAAGELALRANDAALAHLVLARLAAKGATRNDRLEISLVSSFTNDRDRLRGIARRALRQGDTDGRVLAVSVATHQDDVELLAAIEAQLLATVTTSCDSRDTWVLGKLSEHPVAGVGVYDRLKTLPSRNILRRQITDPEMASAWVRYPDVAERVVDDAFQFESTLLNTPREGQQRLWELDPEIALEAFEEGLRRGGRASEHLAALALRHAPDQAVIIIVKRFADVTEPKVRTDLARALRAAANPIALETMLLDLVADEDAQARLSGVEMAGWVMTAQLEAAALGILSVETRSEIRTATFESLEHADRLTVLKRLVSDLDADAAPDRRRRILAIACQIDTLGVLKLEDDPLFLGPRLQTDRETRLAQLWLRRN